jgi:RHS repeat-associated protein
MEFIRVTSPQGVVNYAHDDLGRKTRTFTTVTDSGGVTNVTNDTTYEYDALGRLAKVSVVERNDMAVSPAENTSYRYDLSGDHQTSPDGVVTDQVYDALFRLDKLTEYRPDPNTPGIFTDNPKLAEFDYTVRADGKRTSATETFWINGEAKTNTIAWSYDDAGRLTDEVFDHNDPALDFAEHYVFDLTGNRVRKTLDTGAFQQPGVPDGVLDEAIASLYDANDRLIEERLDSGANGSVDETTTYSWNGTHQTLKSITPTGSQSPASTQTFTYNLQGRMSGIELREFDSVGQVTGSQTLGYTYGPDGIRVSTTDATDTDGNGVIDSRTKTEFLIDAHNFTGYQQLLQETTTNADSGALIQKVVYTIGLDQISQTTFTPSGPATGTTLFFHIDGHGSTRVLTDTLGAIATVAGALQLFHFDAYGNPLGFTPAQAATSFLYNNEQRDVPTGLYNFRARPYDPLSARLLGIDPFAGESHEPQSFHKHAFVHGDPIQGIDPTGEFFGVISFMISIVTFSGIQSGHSENVMDVGGDIAAALNPSFARVWNKVQVARLGFTLGETGVKLGFFVFSSVWPLSVRQENKNQV